MRTNVCTLLGVLLHRGQCCWGSTGPLEAGCALKSVLVVQSSVASKGDNSCACPLHSLLERGAAEGAP